MARANNPGLIRYIAPGAARGGPLRDAPAPSFAPGAACSPGLQVYYRGIISDPSASMAMRTMAAEALSSCGGMRGYARPGLGLMFLPDGTMIGDPTLSSSATSGAVVGGGTQQDAMLKALQQAGQPAQPSIFDTLLGGVNSLATAGINAYKNFTTPVQQQQAPGLSTGAIVGIIAACAAAIGIALAVSSRRGPILKSNPRRRRFARRSRRGGLMTIRTGRAS